MKNRRENYAEAMRLLGEIEEHHPRDFSPEEVRLLLAKAQVHATLAAASVEASPKGEAW